MRLLVTLLMGGFTGVALLVTTLHASTTDLDYMMAVKNYNEFNSKAQKGMSNEETVKEFQKYFLKNVYLKSIFKKSAIAEMYEDDEEDEDDTMVDISNYANSPVHSDLMLDTYAEQLANKDVMRLQEIVIKRRQLANKPKKLNVRN